MPETLANEAFEILGAGTLTTAKVATVATYHILANLHNYNKLREDLRSSPNGDNTGDINLLCDLPLLLCATLVIRPMVTEYNLKDPVTRESLPIACLLTSRLPLVSPEKILHYGDREITPGVSHQDVLIILQAWHYCLLRTYDATLQSSVGMTFPSAGIDPTVTDELYAFLPAR